MPDAATRKKTQEIFLRSIETSIAAGEKSAATAVALALSAFVVLRVQYEPFSRVLTGAELEKHELAVVALVSSVAVAFRSLFAWMSAWSAYASSRRAGNDFATLSAQVSASTGILVLSYFAFLAYTLLVFASAQTLMLSWCDWLPALLPSAFTPLFIYQLRRRAFHWQTELGVQYKGSPAFSPPKEASWFVRWRKTRARAATKRPISFPS